MKDRVLSFTLLALFLTQSCSRISHSEQTRADATAAHPAAAVAPDEFTVATQGMPYALQLQPGLLAFCDGRGARRLDLKTGRDSNSDTPCPKNEQTNVSCSGLSLDVAVQSPQDAPNDTVDIAGSTYPLKGRVHDCAADGKKVAIITGASVVLIDAEKGVTTQISTSGGERIAIGFNWIAWTENSKVRALVLNQKHG